MGTIILITGLALLVGFFAGYFFGQKSQNLQEQFQNIANQALISNQNELKAQNALALEDKLKPLQGVIERYQKEVNDFSKDTTREMTKLMENSRTIQEETHRLTKALTQSQNVKGQFGEDTLEVVLNASGMSEGVHYFKQLAIMPDGATQLKRPDFVVRLPQNHHIIIDSKLNLESFIKYQNEDDKERYLKEFKNDIKVTIKNLAEKKYQSAKEINSPDFIFMYIPLENSLSLIYDDRSIVEYALERNIIIIGTSSLIATIRLVQKLLAEEKQREHYKEIVNTGAKLYEKFVDFSQNLINIQNMLKKVDLEFNTTLNRFKRGEDSLFKSTEKLKEFGIESTKQIPENFLTEEEAAL